jgi:hypothetical protein
MKYRTTTTSIIFALLGSALVSLAILVIVQALLD